MSVAILAQACSIHFGSCTHVISTMDDIALAHCLAHGGRKQRLRAAILSIDGPADHSSMVHALLSYVGWGIISSVTASYLARCALDDGARHPELSALAHIGTSGAHIQNSRRDLLRHFCKFTTVPKPLVGNFTTLSKRHREEITQQSILSLPEVLEGLYVNHRDQLFNEFLGANPRQFWEALDPDDPKLATIAEVTATPGWQDITWPFVLHGDGGVYTRKTESSILVVSSKSLLSKDFECNIIPGFVPKYVSEIQIQ